MTETTVFVTTHFTGFHHWPEAPEEVAFLRNRHRHVFGVKVEVQTDHSDRDVEFFILKKSVDDSIQNVVLPTLEEQPSRSCEMMAHQLYHLLQNLGYIVKSVEVNEDGENGAVVKKL